MNKVIIRNRKIPCYGAVSFSREVKKVIDNNVLPDFYKNLSHYL
jgi:hypothetical protein